MNPEEVLIHISAVHHGFRDLRLFRWMLVLGALAAMLLVFGAREAGAQGTGFTGELYYGGGVQSPQGTYYSPQYHSYGFHSTANISGSARGQVWSAIQNWNNGSVWDAWAVCNDFCRVCMIGTYPNCTDTDGWTGETAAGNDSPVNLRIQGHGVY